MSAVTGIPNSFQVPVPLTSRIIKYVVELPCNFGSGILESREPCDMLDVREKEPRRGIRVRWLAGFTVMMRLELLATIMSVTWSRLLPATSMPFTSSTSSLTAKSPVLSASPPGTSLETRLPDGKI